MKECSSAKAGHGPLQVLLGALAFSTTGSIQALCMPGADVFSLGIVRAGGAGLALFLLCVLCGRLGEFRPLASWISVRALGALAGLVFFQLFFFASLGHAGVTVGTVVTIGTTPIAVGILGWLLLKEKPSRIWYRATAMALLGVGILGASKSGDAGGKMASGVALAVTAGCSYALFVVLSKELVQKRPADVLMTGFFLVTGAIIILMGLVVSDGVSLAWIATTRGLIGALILALFSTAMAYVLTLNGLRTTPVALAATLALGEPLGAAILGIFLLGEPVSAMSLTGIFLLFVRMALLGRQ